MPPLQPFWQQAVPKGSIAYHTIVRALYHTVDVDGITDRTPLTPSAGFDLPPASLALTSTELQLTAAPLGLSTGFDPILEKLLQLAVVVSFSSPIDPSSKPYHLAGIVSFIQPLVLDAALNFSIPLNNEPSSLFSKYTAHRALIAVVTLTENNLPVRHSSTQFCQ
jgi:hypothetical protein